MQHNTNFAQQINKAQYKAMQKDPSMICMGLGIDDPKSIFGTTKGLAKDFGSERVFDIPTSENAMTGIGIGAAIAGTRVLMTHQRVDFFLLAMDQLVNNAAKWHYMFNGLMTVPLTIRLIIGRGWGQGPTHQQSLQSWFAHIPGLKVVVPSLTDNVGQLLYQSLMDNNPTIFLEHRWLHNQQCLKSECNDFEDSFSTVRQHSEGEDITIITNSYLTLETLRAVKELKQHGISADVFETHHLHNIDWDMICNSIKKTGRCLITDIGHGNYSASSEIAYQVSDREFSSLIKAPRRIALPNYPEPTSFGLTKDYYITASKIINTVLELMDRPACEFKSLIEKHDVPGDWFKGPF